MTAVDMINYTVVSRGRTTAIFEFFFYRFILRKLVGVRPYASLFKAIVSLPQHKYFLCLSNWHKSSVSTYNPLAGPLGPRAFSLSHLQFCPQVPILTTCITTFNYQQ